MFVLSVWSVALLMQGSLSCFRSRQAEGGSALGGVTRARTRVAIAQRGGVVDVSDGRCCEKDVTLTPLQLSLVRCIDMDALRHRCREAESVGEQWSESERWWSDRGTASSTAHRKRTPEMTEGEEKAALILCEALRVEQPPPDRALSPAASHCHSVRPQFVGWGVEFNACLYLRTLYHGERG